MRLFIIPFILQILVRRCPRRPREQPRAPRPLRERPRFHPGGRARTPEALQPRPGRQRHQGRAPILPLVNLKYFSFIVYFFNLTLKHFNIYHSLLILSIHERTRGTSRIHIAPPPGPFPTVPRSTTSMRSSASISAIICE